LFNKESPPPPPKKKKKKGESRHIHTYRLSLVAAGQYIESENSIT